MQSELDKWILRDTTVKSERREIDGDRRAIIIRIYVAHMIAHVGVANKGDYDGYHFTRAQADLLSFG